MKNTLYFDNQLNLRLLSNEEDDLNTVWIAIETDSNANQTLQILLNGQTTSIALDSSTATDTEIPASLWALGGDTQFRLVNSSFTSEYQSINFPEILTTDAALYEVSEGSYRLQGQQKDDASAYATQIVAYTNARAYQITNRQVRVISIDFTVSNENTSGVFGCTICVEASDITDFANLTARMMYNRAMDEVFIPIQKIDNGKHIINIHYPLRTMLSLSANNVSVYLSMDSGTLDIEQGAIQASVLAAGLTASEWEWDGRIDIEEAWDQNVPIPSMGVIEGTDSVVFNVQVPTGASISESFSNVSIPSMTVQSATDNVSIVLEDA